LEQITQLLLALAVLVLLLNRVTVAATLCFPLLHPQAVVAAGVPIAALQEVLAVAALVVALALGLLPVLLEQRIKVTLAEAQKGRSQTNKVAVAAALGRSVEMAILLAVVAEAQEFLLQLLAQVLVGLAAAVAVLSALEVLVLRLMVAALLLATQVRLTRAAGVVEVLVLLRLAALAAPVS
jgi:hypothetical protein